MKIRRKHKKSGAPKGGETKDTRRQFLRLGGAGVVGMALESCATMREGGGPHTMDEGDDGLEIVNIVPLGSILYDSDPTDSTAPITAPEGQDVEDGSQINVQEGNQSFELDYEDQPGNGDPPAVDYDNTQDGDYIEVDLTVLEEFEENYDPDPQPLVPDYTITDEQGDTIGING